MNPTGYVLAADPLQHMIGQSNYLVFSIVALGGALAIGFSLFKGSKSRAFAILGVTVLALVLVADPHKVVSTFAGLFFSIL